jgi:hypothetical protein
MTTTYNFEPGDAVKALHHMEKVQTQHDACKPEASHGHGVEPCSSTMCRVYWYSHADEAQNVQKLHKITKIIYSFKKKKKKIWKQMKLWTKNLRRQKARIDQV